MTDMTVMTVVFTTRNKETKSCRNIEIRQPHRINGIT